MATPAHLMAVDDSKDVVSSGNGRVGWDPTAAKYPLPVDAEIDSHRLRLGGGHDVDIVHMCTTCMLIDPNSQMKNEAGRIHIIH